MRHRSTELGVDQSGKGRGAHGGLVAGQARSGSSGHRRALRIKGKRIEGSGARRARSGYEEGDERGGIGGRQSMGRIPIRELLGFLEPFNP